MSCWHVGATQVDYLFSYQVVSYGWSPPYALLITSPPRLQRTTTKQRIRDTHHHLLITTLTHDDTHHGTCHVSVSCDYWLINHTGIADMRYEFGSEALGLASGKSVATNVQKLIIYQVRSEAMSTAVSYRTICISCANCVSCGVMRCDVVRINAMPHSVAGKLHGMFPVARVLVCPHDVSVVLLLVPMPIAAADMLCMSGVLPSSHPIAPSTPTSMVCSREWSTCTMHGTSQHGTRVSSFIITSCAVHVLVLSPMIPLVAGDGPTQHGHWCWIHVEINMDGNMHRICK